MITLKILFILQFVFNLCLIYYLNSQFQCIYHNMRVSQSVISKQVMDLVANYFIRINSKERSL